MKKERKTLLLLIMIIVTVILIITHIKGNGNYDEKTIACIAKNSKLIVSKTCSHCATQLSIIKDYKDEFNITYIDKDPSVLNKYNLKGVPSWIVNEKVYEGVKTIEELKEITKC